MTPALWLLDMSLGTVLVWLAWSALVGTDLFTACIRFIAFGLVLAIVWARLGAPDVALAEAAIGSGLTGALLLGALRRLGFAAWQRFDSLVIEDSQP